MATGDYGEDTGNPASTYHEVQFWQCSPTRKPLIRVRVIPWDVGFETLTARRLFASNDLILNWIRGEPLPVGLVGEILTALGIGRISAASQEDGEIPISAPLLIGGDTDSRLLHPWCEKMMLFGTIPFHTETKGSAHAWVRVITFFKGMCLLLCIGRAFQHMGPSYTDAPSCAYTLIFHLWTLLSGEYLLATLRAPALRELLSSLEGRTAGALGRQMYYESGIATAAVAVVLAVAVSGWVYMWTPGFLHPFYTGAEASILPRVLSWCFAMFWVLGACYSACDCRVVRSLAHMPPVATSSRVSRRSSSSRHSTRSKHPSRRGVGYSRLGVRRSMIAAAAATLTQKRSEFPLLSQIRVHCRASSAAGTKAFLSTKVWLGASGRWLSQHSASTRRERHFLWFSS